MLPAMQPGPTAPSPFPDKPVDVADGGAVDLGDLGYLHACRTISGERGCAVDWKIGAKAGKPSRRFSGLDAVVMSLALSSEPDDPGSSTVSITVLSVTPTHARKLFAFASVEIDIDGVQIGIHGIRAMRGPEGTVIEFPKFRDAGGVWQTAITLPEEVWSPVARAVLDELLRRGLVVRRGTR
jgi:hypothetical protein